MNTDLPEVKAALRWNLRALFLLMVPVCIVASLVGYAQRQGQRARAACDLISQRVTEEFLTKNDGTVFSFANLTDAELDAFIPAFGFYAPKHLGVDAIELKGSGVSEEGIARFHRAVPHIPVSVSD